MFLCTCLLIHRSIKTLPNIAKGFFHRNLNFQQNLIQCNILNSMVNINLIIQTLYNQGFLSKLCHKLIMPIHTLNHPLYIYIYLHINKHTRTHTHTHTYM